jgi:type III secretion system chaperone SycN
MSRLDDVFAELGRRLGMGELRVAPGEPLALDIDGVGRLTFEVADGGEELLATLSWDLAPHDRSTMAAALEAASLERATDFSFQPGLLGDAILLMARRSAMELTAPEVERLIINLAAAKERLASG